MFDFSGQKVLVTGASGGIGEEIVKYFSNCNAVVGLSARNVEKMEKLQKELKNSSFIYKCDLSNVEEVETLFDKADEEMGGVDILICNAGITKDNLSMRMSNEEFDSVLNVNLKSTFILNRNAIKKMMKRKYGRIINITSVVGFTGNAGQANYCASKAGIVGMTKAICQEVASRNITVNCVAPGFIETPMTDVLNEEQKNKILNTIPMKTMGKPSDIANAVLFLASKESSYITGQTLHINGGMFLG